MTQVIQDHTVKIGFDGSDVVKGINDIQKRLNNLKVPKINLGVGAAGGRGGGFTSTVNAGGGGSFERLQENVDRVRGSFDRFVTSTSRKLKGTEELDKLQEKFKRFRQQLLQVSDRKGLLKLRETLANLRTEVAGNVAELRQYNRAVRQASRVTDGFDDSLVNLGRSFVSVFAVIEAGKTIFRLGKEMDSLTAAMLASSNGAREAGENIEFIKQEAERLGVDLIAASQGFTKIGAVTKSLNIPMNETRELFTGISEVSRAFNLGTEDTKLAFLGFSQALSKGVLSMQEVRQQIGERIPIALDSLAKAMKVTVPEMNKMIESGTVISKDIVPAWVAEMQKAVKETGALEAAQKKVVASQARFQNSITLLSEAFFNAGGAAFMKAIFSALTDIVNITRAAFVLLGEALKPITMLFKDSEDATASLSFAVKVLAGLLIQALIPATTATGAAAVRGGIAMRFFGNSMLFAAGAAKALLRALGIGLLLEGVGFAADRFLGTRPSISAGIGGGTGGNASTTNITNTDVQISVDGSGDPSAVGEAVRREMTAALATNLQTGNL